jgi:hypothetical protein
MRATLALMRLIGSLALAILLLFTAACGSKGAVSLVAGLSAPELQVEQLTLGARLKGGFDLVLEVGPEAEGGTEVSIENFALARGGTTVVAPLLAAPVDATLPLAVGKGQRRFVRFAIDESKFIEPGQRDQLCAGPVRITGAIRDTLSGGNVSSVASPDVVPACP